MPKGYWIARVDVHDPESYKEYAALAMPCFARHKAKILARGGVFEGVEGTARARNVVIEFPSLDAAKACYFSPEYQVARLIRQRYSDGEIVLVEGLDA